MGSAHDDALWYGQLERERRTGSLTERLRIWPAADGADGLSGSYVGPLMEEAANRIEQLEMALELSKARTADLKSGQER